MRSKNYQLSNFCHGKPTTSICFRPDNEWQLESLFAIADNKGLLARGKGASYGDCCLNDQGIIIDTTRLNHLLSFDEESGILVCQGGTTFADLFSVSSTHLPPVVPGTLHATVAGGIANDVHGKNNHGMGSFGQHVQWIDLQLGEQTLRCSPKENSALFHATIGGLGLTGIIKRAAIQMHKATHFVKVNIKKYFELEHLFHSMQNEGCGYDYQVAWLDLLNKPCALLSVAKHCDPLAVKPKISLTLPDIPLPLVRPWSMRQFNRYYFKKSHPHNQSLPFAQFNNPLDAIKHWNRLYGKRGFLQFQALFATDLIHTAIEQFLSIIHHHRATPTLAVLKYFTEPGSGLLSFVQPGFTLAVDFINNQNSRRAISAMNEWVTQKKGRTYLGKDLLLTKAQFTQQYDQHEQFTQILKQYKSPMRSDLSNRLGLTP
ncbi:FAD-binding oxidoreductase [Legionella fairfieldensis]|uniref:FAD-binding oxidoreductase n=1 Tax=Legionella fairfieldensis TaxID=45064 RepID=UPI000491FBCC|nr:FAD-binding oxidoreductase [Legionella fairfieldensis]